VDAWLVERAAQIAVWLPRLLAGAALVGFAWFVVLSRRARRAPVRSWTSILGRAAALCLTAGSVLGLASGYTLMAPLFRSASALQATIGREAPDMNYRRVDDDAPQRLHELRGRVVLVNLWGTWCAPCREEMPTLDQLQRDYASRGLVVLTLSDETRDQIAPFVAEHSPRTLNGYVQNYGWLSIQEFRPFTLVIDRNGILREFLFGGQDYEVFERKVLPYL
jgi:thiol-disulfide isomerase/thioredoxin